MLLHGALLVDRMVVTLDHDHFFTAISGYPDLLDEVGHGKRNCKHVFEEDQ
jgi:hypothetical protein